MGHFTPVDAMNSSNFLREVVLSDWSSTLHFLMPVAGFGYNGQPVTPPGFDQEYGLYLTIDAAHPPGTGLAGVSAGHTGCDNLLTLLRPTATYRNVTSGFRSQWGADLFANVRSIAGTAARRGTDAFQAIRAIICGGSVLNTS